MKRFLLISILLLSIAAEGGGATLVTATARGVVVAENNTMKLFDRDGRNVVWSTESVQTPTLIVASNDRVAVIDAIANRARIIDLAARQAVTVKTGETPIAGAFVGRELYLLERDARALDRIGTDGARASIDVAADPAFLRERNDVLYVYSRLEGVLQQVTASPFAIRRAARVSPFASDLEVDARSAYLVYPRAAKIEVVTLDTMKSAGKFDAGAVPVDLAFASAGTALTARTLAIADPSGKRVWLIEGQQSLSQAIARGFLRGLLGLGLFGGSGSQFPSGIDRVFVRGARWYAYDSSTGTLYRFTKKKSAIVAKNVSPAAFSTGPGGLYVWDEAVRRLQRIDPE